MSYLILYITDAPSIQKIIASYYYDYALPAGADWSFKAAWALFTEQHFSLK